ncbi:hypothetical protein DL762_006063 [Monosporascus cannonballus]|uniref:Uncharacterized protein n=1 Tax=Monosporascus cannonballus TaxID=155416 RepID=A0ABY0H7H6_9PEZI|nr:hypothetical protein DL762_006063 [Monosporascus cannonballus]
MARLSLPTAARLSSSIRVDPTNSAVLKALNRLSRPTLISLVLDWLDEKNLPLCPPLLHRRRRAASEGEEGGGDDDVDDDNDDDDDDEEYEGDFYPPARSLAELQDFYASLQAGKGSKREVLDRIVEGDWRHGLTLYQLAMADLQHLYEHPGSLKWTAYRVQRLRNPLTEDDVESGRQRHDGESLAVPRFHPSTFLQNLQAEVPPDVKAHYNFDRPKGLPLLLLRVFVLDSPYSTSLAVSNRSRAGARGRRVTNFDAARTIYIAFPDASPHIYISAAQSSGNTGPAGRGTSGNESRSLRALVVDAIPKALSRPRERYTFVPTGFSTRNLSALLHTKGAGRTNGAGGGWGIYASSPSTTTSALASGGLDPGDVVKKSAGVSESPLNAVLLPTPPLSDAEGGSKTNKRKWKPPADPAEAQHERTLKRAAAVAQARFGHSARIDDGKGVERLDVLIEDPFPDATPAAVDAAATTEEREAGAGDPQPARKARGRRSNADLMFARQDQDADAGDGDGDAEGGGIWRPRIRLTFHGTHVFAGVRQLVEAGIVDGERMPGWMTGEEGVTIGTIRHGRVRGHKGVGF